MLQKLLGKSNASKPKVKNIEYDNSVRTVHYNYKNYLTHKLTTYYYHEQLMTY